MQSNLTSSMEMPVKEEFLKQGTSFPHDLLTPEETKDFRDKLVAYLESVNWKLDAINRHKPHMYLKWANDLGRHPKLVNMVKQLLGEDVLLWYSVIFVKPAQSKGRVPWHQDSTYWAMNKEVGLTAWIALSDVNVENGCMYVVPGSHETGGYRHEINNSADNMLHRGQQIADVNEESKVPVVLKPGQVSFHDLRLLHMSGPNQSVHPRLGIAFRFIPASNFPRTLKWLKRSATLVSGKKVHDYFIDDPMPKFDFDPEAMKSFRRSIRVAAVHTLFGDTSRSGLRKALDTVPILISRKSADYFKYWKNLAE